MGLFLNTWPPTAEGLITPLGMIMMSMNVSGVNLSQIIYIVLIHFLIQTDFCLKLLGAVYL